MSISSALDGNTGCRPIGSPLVLMQELVILWVTLFPGWDTRPNRGHELVLDLLPGVLLEVCLDGTWFRNLPLQFCMKQNESAMNMGSKLGFFHILFFLTHAYLPQYTVLCLSGLLSKGEKVPSPAPAPSPTAAKLSLQESGVLAQISAQGPEPKYRLRALLCSPPTSHPVPPCSHYNGEHQKRELIQSSSFR